MKLDLIEQTILETYKEAMAQGDNSGICFKVKLFNKQRLVIIIPKKYWLFYAAGVDSDFFVDNMVKLMEGEFSKTGYTFRDIWTITASPVGDLSQQEAMDRIMSFVHN